MIGINTFLTWPESYRTIRIRRPPHLVTYLHQLTMPGSVPVSPQDSSVQRTAWLALRARAASWAVLVEDALLADGSFDRPLGMAAGSAIRPPLSGSAVLSTALEASPCCPWELEGSMALNLVGGRCPDHPVLQYIHLHMYCPARLPLQN